jgi:hypothetical protein
MKGWNLWLFLLYLFVNAVSYCRNIDSSTQIFSVIRIESEAMKVTDRLNLEPINLLFASKISWPYLLAKNTKVSPTNIIHNIPT